MVRSLMIYLLLLPALFLILALRVLFLNRKPGESELIDTPLHDIEVLEKLAELIRCATVSHPDLKDFPMEEFHRLNQTLPSLYPRAFEHLEDLSLSPLARIFLWKGSDSSLEPVLMVSHNDVVAAPPEGWDFPPFEGSIHDDTLYGRGTQDIKIQTAAMLEGMEELLRQNFRPKRSIYFAIGGDEEVSSRAGAMEIAKWFREQKMRFHFVLDEGGIISKGQLNAFTPVPVALLGVEEKGRVTYSLEIAGEGGHASMPPKATSIGTLALSLARLVKKKYPSRLTLSVRKMLEGLVPYSGFAQKILLANLWLFGPLIRFIFSMDRTTNSIVRTTRTLTMIQGGTRVNVLPPDARASFNISILPGDSLSSIERGLQKQLRGTGIRLYREEGLTSTDPVMNDRLNQEVLDLVSSKIHQVFPGIAAVPFLLNGTTDSKFYKEMTSQIIRFTPLSTTAEDLKRIHGVNERVTLENYSGAIHFYKELFREL